MFTFEIPSKSFTVGINGIRAIGSGLRGVYVARNEFGDCLYVGQTYSLKNRLKQHMRNSPFRAHIDRFDIYVIKDGFEREICETLFIDRMNPRYNKAKVFERFDEEIARIIDEIEELEADRIVLRDERATLKSWLRRDYYTGDMDSVTEDYYDYFTDEDECRGTLLGEDLSSLDRLEEIESEIRRLSSRINGKYSLLSG